MIETSSIYGDTLLYYELLRCATTFVTDVEATERVLDTVNKQWGNLDIVFANAGFHEITPIGQTSVEQFERVIRANLCG